jgi:hypothetical protein
VILQRIDPPIPLDTPKGPAWAYFVIDYSQDHNLRWVTFVRDTGECWTWRNADVRLAKNITENIRNPYCAKSESALQDGAGRWCPTAGVKKWPATQT